MLPYAEYMHKFQNRCINIALTPYINIVYPPYVLKVCILVHIQAYRCWILFCNTVIGRLTDQVKCHTIIYHTHSMRDRTCWIVQASCWQALSYWNSISLSCYRNNNRTGWIMFWTSGYQWVGKTGNQGKVLTVGDYFFFLCVM